jgi:hypothetical protein
MNIPQKTERTFTVSLTESELVLLVSALWNADLKAHQLHNLAAAEGNRRQADARRASGEKARALADRLCQLGGAAS